MKNRIAEKRAKNKFRKVMAYEIERHLGVKVKPSRVHLVQYEEPNGVVLIGKAGGCLLKINFLWDETEDSTPQI